MNEYVPFLKLKVNEIAALCVLADDLKRSVIPFLDLPRKKEGMSSEEFVALVDKSVRSVQKNLKGIETFYLDNFDIEDAVKVNGNDSYNYVIEKFAECSFIPVTGLDRGAGRSQLVFDAKKAGKIKSPTVAIRLQEEDFDAFSLVEEDIAELYDQGKDLFERWVLVLDNRLCLDVDVEHRANLLLAFIQECWSTFPFDEVIITGSSIPASIGEVVDTLDEGIHERRELAISKIVFSKNDDERLVLGDYTIVSPLYSDIDIPPEAMRNVTAPKLLYTFGSQHYIFRGGRLSSHPRGNQQYNDLAARLVAMSFYRKSHYSFGDNYLAEKAISTGNGVTPSSILKPTINAHMTYMLRDFVL